MIGWLRTDGELCLHPTRTFQKIGAFPSPLGPTFLYSGYCSQAMVKPQKSTDVNDEISPTSIAHEVNDLKSALASFAAMIEDFRHENGSRFVAITNKLEDVDHKTATLQTSIGDLQDDFQAIKKFNSTIQSEFDDTLKHTEANLRHDFRSEFDVLRSEFTTFQQQVVLSGSSSSPTTKSGPKYSLYPFFQPDTKDFQPSKLTKLLVDQKTILKSDSLCDLELFHDSILGAFNCVLGVKSAFPLYRDLFKGFNFYDHFCSSTNWTGNPTEYAIMDANYFAFGVALRTYLLQPTTISMDACPDGYLQLLSLRDDPCGFTILSNFIYLRSPQLGGKFHDFRLDIANIQLISGEHIRFLYTRVKTLSNEIEHAKPKDGSMTVLMERFLSLLRSTANADIGHAVAPYWIKLQQFKRNSEHVAQKLPFSYENVLQELEYSGVTTIVTKDAVSTEDNHHLMTSIAAYAGRPLPSTPNLQSTGKHTMFRTKDGRRFIRSPQEHQVRCRLCDNKHLNLWQVETDCPYHNPELFWIRIAAKPLCNTTPYMDHTRRIFTRTKILQEKTTIPTQLLSPPQANLQISILLMTYMKRRKPSKMLRWTMRLLIHRILKFLSFLVVTSVPLPFKHLWPGTRSLPTWYMTLYSTVPLILD